MTPPRPLPTPHLLGLSPKFPCFLVWKDSLSQPCYGFLLPRTSNQKSSNSIGSVESELDIAQPQFISFLIGNNFLEFCIMWVYFVFTKLQAGGCFNSHLCVLHLLKSLVGYIKPIVVIL